MEILKNCTAEPMIAVEDMARAKNFYGYILGLKTKDSNMPGMFEFTSGDRDFLVYESDYAGTNKANTLAWTVGDDFDKVIKYLKSKDVKFDRFPDLEGVELDGDIHRFGDEKMVWIEDPDGNILCINQ